MKKGGAGMVNSKSEKASPAEPVPRSSSFLKKKKIRKEDEGAELVPNALNPRF
jgi:hypothetical protein